MELIVKNLNSMESPRTFLDGSRRSVVILKSVAIGRGEYLPGWKWSTYVGKQTGKSSEAHIGYVVSGHMAVRAADGTESKIGPGETFEVQANHDAWVIGDEPCVALDFEHFKESA